MIKDACHRKLTAWIPAPLCLMTAFLYSGPEAFTPWPTTLSAGPIPGQTLQDHEGEPVSLKLVDASVVDFFRVISELSGLNLLIDPDVKGTLTIHVEQVPWDQLLDAVLNSHGLDKSLHGNLLRISTQETLKSEKEAALLAMGTTTKARHLNYADAKQVYEALTRERAFLTDQGELLVDERTNTLFITDVPESVQRFQAMLDAIDVAERQVEIEARIIEATTSFAREIGVQLGFSTGRPGGRNRAGIQISAPVGNPIGTAVLSGGKSTDTLRLDALITAAELKGDARILSQPRVTARNNAEAVITQGARIPIPVQVNFTTNVRFETAALRLAVTPHINEQTIDLKIKLENNIPDFSRTVLGIPTILTSEAETQVTVSNGGTTVIGGIFVETDREAWDKVPGLGDVPILGHLFKRTSVERETREILFFLTPTIKM